MSAPLESWQFLVIGAGPAGQKAAVQAAKAGRRVLLVDREPGLGGECVHRGTIPSKTLRASAIFLSGLRERAADWLDVELPAQTHVQGLMRRLDQVRRGHEVYMASQMARNEIETVQGLARFLSPAEVEIALAGGGTRRIRAERVLIAAGSRPRTPPEIPVDHERIFDSDSILSLVYLPASLTVLGGGVIACEFATIFQALGVDVTMIDRAPRPLSFLDEELSLRFAEAFEQAGGRLIPGGKHLSVELDELGQVRTRLDGGAEVLTEIMLCAQGRVANLRGMDIAKAGIQLSERGLIPVDPTLRTTVPHIYAAGDCIGPPALATTSMEQGRRAAAQALGLEVSHRPEDVPAGIYTIPEMSMIGLTEAQARETLGGCVVGRARFEELARGQIDGNTTGFIKLVADPAGRRIVGAHVLGEGACELVHLAQLAMAGGMEVDVFVENIFNFPTLAEGYRVAALDIVGRRASALRRAG